MSVTGRWREHVTEHGYREDPAQAEAVVLLEDLRTRLLADRPEGLGARLLRRLRGGPATPVTGLYLWGGVGRGKTWLMDLFHESLPPDTSLRMHFHRFMRRAHDELRDLAGRSDPLEAVADRLAGEARVICFDEFYVSDITDAMILGELLDALFARRVTLVATSNVPPRDLYRDGLQRQRFLPAIDLLEQHTRVVELDGGIDHRLRALEQAELFHHPLDAGADASLEASLAALSSAPVRRDVPLAVEGRTIHARAVADDVVWFDFVELCEGPRSQNDYIEIAREFHAVLVSGVPRFTPTRDDAARRFIALVDEFYDRGVKLILSAEAAIGELYAGERLAFEFERTISRLLEMQSRDYLARVHRA